MDLNAPHQDEEVLTTQDAERFAALEAQGFERHFFDDTIDTHREQFDALIAEVRSQGWTIETIIKGKNIYCFVRR